MMPVDMMRVFQQEMMLRQGSNFWPHVERQGSVIPVIPPAAATMPYGRCEYISTVDWKMIVRKNKCVDH